MQLLPPDKNINPASRIFTMKTRQAAILTALITVSTSTFAAEATGVDARNVTANGFAGDIVNPISVSSMA